MEAAAAGGLEGTGSGVALARLLMLQRSVIAARVYVCGLGVRESVGCVMLNLEPGHDQLNLLFPFPVLETNHE